MPIEKLPLREDDLVNSIIQWDPWVTKECVTVHRQAPPKPNS